MATKQVPSISASGRVTARTTIEIEEPSANEREHYVAGQPDTDIVGTGETVFEAIRDFVTNVENAHNASTRAN